MGLLNWLSNKKETTQKSKEPSYESKMLELLKEDPILADSLNTFEKTYKSATQLSKKKL
jgi:hypothetical protein